MAKANYTVSVRQAVLPGLAWTLLTIIDGLLAHVYPNPSSQRFTAKVSQVGDIDPKEWMILASAKRDGCALF